ncbi:MAG: hypothetical protein HRU19_20240 [Pseudobacteriovorax sp.]|nr:hypothetical protein [Pseudobacteriovorax sp.]
MKKLIILIVSTGILGLVLIEIANRSSDKGHTDPKWQKPETVITQDTEWKKPTTHIELSQKATSAPQASEKLLAETYSEEAKSHERYLQMFEDIAATPGAYQLAMSIKERLQNDPNAIRLDLVAQGPDHILEDNYLEIMIPDEELRTMWVELMDIILAENAHAAMIE